MKKNISFIIISLLIINILFVTAATCNMCGKPLEISIGSTETEDTEKQQMPQAGFQDKNSHQMHRISKKVTVLLQ